jgi:hypothetical protein
MGYRNSGTFFAGFENMESPRNKQRGMRSLYMFKTVFSMAILF